MCVCVCVCVCVVRRARVRECVRVFLVLFGEGSFLDMLSSRVCLLVVLASPVYLSNSMVPFRFEGYLKIQSAVSSSGLAPRGQLSYCRLKPRGSLGEVANGTPRLQRSVAKI